MLITATPNTRESLEALAIAHQSSAARAASVARDVADNAARFIGIERDRRHLGYITAEYQSAAALQADDARRVLFFLIDASPRHA